MSRIVLGCDPGFATLGLAAVELGPSGPERVLRTWVVRTEKSPKKLETRASDDNVRRAREIAQALVLAVCEFSPVAIAAEAQSWPRNAGSAAKVALAWGVLCAVAESHALPLVQASPQRLKLAVCGRKTATKEDMIEAVCRRLPGVGFTGPAGLWEHQADAVAAVLACADSSALQMARRLAS